MAILSMIERLLKEDNGATGIEYGLLAALIAAVVVGAQSALSAALNDMYVTTMGLITAAIGS